MKKIALLSALLSLFPLIASNAFAVETSFTPRLVLSGEYTDNLDRTPDNEEEDYIMTASPGFTLGFRGVPAELTIDYNPAYVHYDKNDDRDHWRHFAALTGNWRAARHTQFDLRHTLIVSEDPLDDEGTSTVEGGQNRYMRNSGEVSVVNQFGRANSIELGFDYSLLENSENDLEDSQRYNPYGDFTWWFIGNQYGMSLRLDYVNGAFEESDDFDSYVGRFRLMKRFSRKFNMFLQYIYGETDYDGETENYKVHNPAIGFDYVAGEHTNISLAVGYGIRERELSENDEGLIVTGDVETAWIYPRGAISVTATSGYTQDTFSTENLGFYMYSGAEVRAEYGFTRRFSGDLFGIYRYAQYLDQDPKIEDNVYSGGAGLEYQPLRWMSIRLEYRHRTFTSTEDIREYAENRAMLSVRFEPAEPYRLN